MTRRLANGFLLSLIIVVIFSLFSRPVVIAPISALGDDFDMADKGTVEQDFKILNELHVDYFRFGIPWDRIETQKGVYDWAFWDDVVGQAESHHVRLIPYICYTPDWAAGQGADSYHSPPLDPKAYGDFVKTIVTRYKDKIHYWELWNEPDNRDFWRGSLEQFAQMVSLAAMKAREADPNAVLILGGFARLNDFSRDAIQKYHLDRLTNVVALHGYKETWADEPSEWYLGDVWSLQSWLTSPAQAIWMNEMGFSSAQVTDGPGVAPTTLAAARAFEHSPVMQAVSLWKYQILMKVSQSVALTVWYRIRDLPPTSEVIGDSHNRNLGLMTYDGKRKPGFYAYEFFRRFFREPVVYLPSSAQVQNEDGGSDAMLWTFKRDEHTWIITAWLRGLPFDERPRQELRLRRLASAGADGSPEVPVVDTRREILDVSLPVAAIRDLHAYNIDGSEASAQPKFDHNLIRNVSLRNGEIFIAEVTVDR